MRLFFFKTLILITFLVGIVFHAEGQGTNVSLIVTTVDGTEQTFHLTESSRMFFENGTTLVIEEETGTTISYELADIRKLVCSEVTGTSENATSQLQILPNPTRNSFIIHNLCENSLARIYSLDGRLVKAFQASEGSVIDLSELSEGMYLLNINGRTLKLMKL